MPSLAELSDYYPQQDTTLPVASAIPANIQRVYINTAAPAQLPDMTQPITDARPEPLPEPISPQIPDNNGFWSNVGMAGVDDKSGVSENPIIKRLFGLGGEERYQTWPEKIVREALAAPHDVIEQGALPPGLRREDFTDKPVPNGFTVANSPADPLVSGAQAVSALAGTGGLAGADASLGSTAFLRPALKYENKIYKAPMGGQHLDALPAHLAEDFQTKAMAGEDINHYNFGFMNHKGQFLSRETALDYAVKEGLVDPSAGQYGALTSTLMADSSKPGTAIESLAKTAPKLESVGDGRFYIKDADSNHLGRVAVQPSADGKTVKILHMEAGKENALGLPAIQALKSQLKTFYPEATNVEGFRVGGANPGRNLNTLLADSSKPGTAIEAMAKTGSPFYSALEHNVGQISQSKMTGDQWLGTLANKPGVKPEELDWTGVKSFLEERGKQPVTKAELQEHLQNNKVELKEVDKADKVQIDPVIKFIHESLGPASKHITDAASIADARKFNAHFRETTKGMSDEEVLAAARASEKLEGIGDSKYHSYQLPGGSNYREKLLTLPKDAVGPLIAKRQALDTRIEELRDSMRGTSGTDEIRSQIRKAQIEKDIVNSNLIKAKAETYRSSHWDESNILAHVRMNDRMIDGKKSLHLEEIQSDWHQQGKKAGYDDPAFRKAAEEKLNKAGYPVSGEDARSAFEDGKITKEEADAIGNRSYIPDAPFKKTWHELALKRMIREAAEGGYSRLSWTPGEAQAARYDLSKQIDKLSYDPKSGHLQGFKGGGMALDNIVPKDKLPDFVGKEAADKILNKPTKILGNGYHTLENADLKIGGEGMKGFYDQIVPKSLEKISGEKVKTANLNSKDEKLGKGSVTPRAIGGYRVEFPNGMAEVYSEKDVAERALASWKSSHNQPIHYIDIPQSLKDKAMSEGFPLFSSTHMFTPVAGNPFQSDKKK